MFIWAMVVIIIAKLFFDYKGKLLEASKSNQGGNFEKKLDYLLEENQDLKEEIQELKFLMGVGDKDSISIETKRYRKDSPPLNGIYTDYEKEQIRIDNQNKFKY